MLVCCVCVCVCVCAVSSKIRKRFWRFNLNNIYIIIQYDITSTRFRAISRGNAVLSAGGFGSVRLLKFTARYAIGTPVVSAFTVIYVYYFHLCLFMLNYVYFYCN